MIYCENCDVYRAYTGIEHKLCTAYAKWASFDSSSFKVTTGSNSFTNINNNNNNNNNGRNGSCFTWLATS